MSATILIVDDSLTVRMDLADAFREAGYEVLLSATLAEARAIIAATPLELIILDQLLPDGDGIDLLSELRGHPDTADVAVVMLSTEAEVKDRIRGLKTGADEYVGKPYDKRYMLARTEQLLRQRRGPPSTRPAVLVIDDSATFREALRAALDQAGYAVFIAADGEEGLRMAAANRPAAVLVDGVLPGIDGATVVRRIRLDAALRDVPCLLLTASDDMDAELSALDAGADSFVRKESSLDVVLARLAAVLRRAALPQRVDDTSSMLSPKRILAVDDSPTFLTYVSGSLRAEGYDVICARSGEEAIELLAVQTVDCILLDLVMPGLSGQETCSLIKSAAGVRDIPLIMLTSLDDRDAMLQGLSAGADDYVSKASELDVLKARVRAQLRRRQFEDENRRVREGLMRGEMEAAEARAARELADTRAVLVQELERRNRDLAHANVELDAFSFSVSHDLRAPLRAVSGFSAILERDYSGTMPSDAQELLQHVRQAAKRMELLIEDLLRLSRLGRQPLKQAQVNLRDVAHEVIDEMAKDLAGRHVDIEIGELPVVVGDRGLLRQALTNLISNAVKFTRRRERAHIEIGSRQEAGETVCYVRDNGAGFDMRYSDRLFGVFQRLHGEEQFDGTGVGLSLTKRIINRHDGRIWAEAEVDKGATFFFTFPNHYA